MIYDERYIELLEIRQEIYVANKLHKLLGYSKGHKPTWDDVLQKFDEYCEKHNLIKKENQHHFSEQQHTS